MADTPKRPSSRDPEIITAAVEAILPDVMGWLSEGRHDIDEVRQQLIRCSDDDAYRFACNLESRCYWFPDFDLVEILSGFSTWSARHTAIKAWVLANDITVPFAIGDTVTARNQAARIVDIREKTAEVIVQPIEPDGKNYGTKGGWVFAVESVEARP